VASDETYITGLDEIARELENLPLRVAAGAVRPALNAAGQVFEAALENAVPRDTGELAGSIRHKVHVDRNLDNMGVIVGPAYMGGHKHTSTDPGVRGKFLELGTRKMAPRFWMRRAFESSKGAAVDTAVAVLKAIIGNLPK
jgi:HK97 gp10 family phage protein